MIFSVAYPFQKVFYLGSHKVGNTINFLGSISELKKENESLIIENNKLASEVAMLSSQKNENETLREQLNLAPRDKFNLKSSFIIGQDPQGLGTWVMIDKGSDDGIASGMPVIVSEGILIGKTDEVYPDSTKIDLLTSPTSTINAVDLETGARGVVRGEFGLGVVLDMVSQTDSLNVGDTIVTSGLGSNMPKGLLVGRIQDVKPTDDKLFQQAIITPRVKYSKLDTAFVLAN